MTEALPVARILDRERLLFKEEFDSESVPARTGAGISYLGRAWPYFRRHLGLVILAAGLLLASALLGLLGPILVKHAIDVDIASKSLAGLLRTAGYYLLVLLGTGVAGYAQALVLARVGERATADLKHAIFHHVLRLPATTLDSLAVGKLITRTEGDCEALRELFATTVTSLARNLVLVVGMGIVMATVNWRLFLIVFSLLPIFAAGLLLLQRRVQPLYLAIRKTAAAVNNFITEALHALPVVQAFNRQDWFGARFDELNRHRYQQELRGQQLWLFFWLLLDIGEVAALAAVLGLGGLWTLRGSLTVGGLFLFYSYISRLFGPLRGLSQQVNVAQRAVASAQRVFGLLDQPEEPLAGQRFERLSSELRFEDVTFAYPGRPAALANVSFTVRRGERVALVGETGGGKTSIVALALKLYQPQSGRILFDGTDIRDLDARSLRQRIGFVPQEVMLFPGTVLDNLRLFDETIPAERVLAAARRARIHERLVALPDGYETNLVERGLNLSLGERQLLAIARAFVLDPEILILDEATSSVDPETERLIQEGIRELLAGRTAILIAHRLATVQMADRILVVAAGRVVQQGTHAELLAQEGQYQQLFRLQYLTATDCSAQNPNRYEG